MKYSISIVSHNSGPLIADLLKDIKLYPPDEFEIILTLNCPEQEDFLAHTEGLPLTVIRNPRPLGFGANHNQAFASAKGMRFVIVNPDIRLKKSPWQTLENAFEPGVGASAPQVFSPYGFTEDSVRRYPTISRLLRRVILKARTPDYTPNSPTLSPMPVDWAAGMFVVFDSDAFRRIGGFDTRYHMYFEDVDICQRLNIAGYRVMWAPSSSVIHHAQRASRRSLIHLRWHIHSALRYLTGL